MHATTIRASAVFDIKSASLPLIALVLKTTDLDALSDGLAERIAQSPNFFDDDPVLIDLAPVREAEQAIDFVALVQLLYTYKMRPVGVRNGSAEQIDAAAEIGLSRAPDTSTVDAAPDGAAASEQAPQAPTGTPAAPLAPFTLGVPTLVIDKPVRSGQRVYARGGDVIVLALVNYDAEIIADGHVHIYAPLRGKAIAGAHGDPNARIYTTCLEAQLLAIAGIYRTAETPIPDDLRGKPAQVRLVGERLVMEALGD